ncbi:hypothetical protein Tco_1332349 [Tanacetum coccineum]
MRTEMELTLEQTQQGVSYEVSNIRVISITMKMEILLEPTSNKLMVEHAEFDESDTYVLERFDTQAGNPVKKILLKLNLSDHRILKDVHGEVTSSQDGKVYKMAKRDYAWLMISRSSKITLMSRQRNKLTSKVKDHYIKSQVNN